MLKSLSVENYALIEKADVLWRDGFWWFFGLGMVSTFGGLVSVGFCSVFCWFLCFWMLWAVVFILGRWLVWWFGFCRVFGFLQSFASLYRCQCWTF